MASNVDIAKAFDKRLGALSNLPSTVGYDNMAISLDDEKISLITSFVPSQPEYPTVMNSKPEENGFYRVLVIGKFGVGRGETQSFAESIRNHFSRGLVLSENGVSVRIRKSVVHPGIVDENKYKIPITIYYQSYS